MEDYTYHLNPVGKCVLGAHMLEVCPSIADRKPSLQVHSAGHRRQDGSAAWCSTRRRVRPRRDVDRFGQTVSACW